MATELYHSQCEILVQALVNKGVVTDARGTGNWPCHADEEPDGEGAPDDVVTVYDTQGKVDGSSQHDGYLWQHHGFQVRIRSNTKRKGWRKADELLQTMSRSILLETITLDDRTYTLYCAGEVGPILSVGKEAPNSSRRIWTINGTLAIRATN